MPKLADQNRRLEYTDKNREELQTITHWQMMNV